MRTKDRFWPVLCFLATVSLGMDLQKGNADSVVWDVILVFLTFSFAIEQPK